jgi:hypothetical protein
MYVGAPGGVQDRAEARMRPSAASDHQLQDRGAVHHRHRQAVQAGPQKDLPLSFSVIFRLNFIVAVAQPKFYNKFSTYLSFFFFKFRSCRLLKGNGQSLCV